MLRLAAALIVAAATLSPPQPDVLFSVREAADGLVIEPIAMVTKTPGPCPGCWTLTFAEPPRNPDRDGSRIAGKQFAARYYSPGRTYRVLVGGAKVGTARVSKKTELGCVSLAASVDITPPLPKERWSALAVGSLRVAPRKAVRYEPTAVEEKVMWSLAGDAFRARGVPAALFANMDGSNFVSADLNGDGKRDLIGSFEVRDAKARITHRLFLIALGDDAGGYRTEYVWYFRLSGDEGRTETVLLVDTIDLDEDGTDEVIVSNTFYESHEYEILKRGRGGKWTRVYRGGGSGC